MEKRARTVVFIFLRVSIMTFGGSTPDSHLDEAGLLIPQCLICVVWPEFVASRAAILLYRDLSGANHDCLGCFAPDR